MSLRSASGALDEMAKHDPRRALREAERRRARRERNAIDERNLALGTPTQRSSAHRPSSAPFDSSTGRFDDPLTRHLREQIAPGAYEQSHATVATLVDAKFNPFEYGTHDVRLLDRALANAGGSEEALQGVLTKLHERPRGWLRGDYHRWLRAQDNGFDGTRMRERQQSQRQSVADERMQHASYGRWLQRSAAAQRAAAAGQRELVQEQHSIDFQLTRGQADCRHATLLSSQHGWADHKAKCRLEMRSELPESPPSQRSPRRSPPRVQRGLEHRVTQALKAWTTQGEEHPRGIRGRSQRPPSTHSPRHPRRKREPHVGDRRDDEQLDEMEPLGRGRVVIFDWWCDCAGPGCLRPEQRSYTEDHRCFGYSRTIKNDGTDYVCCEACFTSGRAKDPDRLILIAGPPAPAEEVGMVAISEEEAAWEGHPSVVC